MLSMISNDTERLAKEIVDIAYKIHKNLGPGLLESVYEKCFCHELSLRKIGFTRQQLVEIVYENIVISDV